MVSWLGRVFAVLAVTMLSGCGLPDYLNDGYGKRSQGGAESVNGTSVLATMFTKAGHDVRSWRLMSPALDKADVIVWFPSDHKVPTPEAQTWLYEWLSLSADSKTLIFVGRDYDAAPLYWRSAQTLAPPAQRPQFKRREGMARSEFLTTRGAGPTSGSCGDWFTIDTSNPERKVSGLQGPWALGIDATKVQIDHHQYLTPSGDFEPLLADQDGHPLVSEMLFDATQVSWTDNDSRLVLVENGAFLLNGSLVNHEHRKLAGKLVSSVGSPELDVVFLESDASPLVQDEDPSDGPPTGFRLFSIWPIGATLAQLAALGIVFATTRFPIFGVPKRLSRPSLTDFGRHVAAIGRLLAATSDRAYAYTQLRNYFHTNEDITVSPPSQPDERNA